MSLDGSSPVMLLCLIRSIHSAGLSRAVSLGASCVTGAVLSTGNPDSVGTDRSPALVKFLCTCEHRKMFATTSTK